MKTQRLLILALVLGYPAISQAQLEPVVPANPWVGTHGAATMHGDTASSDTTPLPGPGAGAVRSQHTLMFGACSTVLIRKDGQPMVLCTSWLGRNPTVHLLDKTSSRSLAQLTIPAGSLLGGVYAYLDHADRLVMVDGEHNLIRVKASKYKTGLGLITRWKLTLDEQIPLRSVVTAGCEEQDCDAVVSISPDGDGSVWFATRAGLVGIYHPTTGTIEHTVLAEGEAIHNSFSTTNDGRAAIATDHALYLLQKDAFGFPSVVWRNEYDRGSARQPGQLSHGTGATPTFFGPTDGTEFVMITDNADVQTSLLVFDASVDTSDFGGNGGELICQHGVFDANASGTENSAIGIGSSVFLASTYGYPYPALPEGAGPSVPDSADFVGGMARIDVREDRSGCELIWQNKVSSAAVPKLSLADAWIYTIARDGSADTYRFTVVDPYTGDVANQTKVGQTLLHNTLQMAGNIGADGVYWQGTVGGIIRVSP